MTIDWLNTEVVIHQAGHYSWRAKVTRNPAWSRWVFDHQLRLCLGGEGRISLRDGRHRLRRGTCQWLRSGWDYEIVGSADAPLEFLTIRFDLLGPSGQRRPNSGGLPPEDLPNVDAHYVEIEMRRIIADAADLMRDTQKVGFARKMGNLFVGARRWRAAARLKALLMELDERVAPRPSSSQSPVHLHPRAQKLQEIARRVIEQTGEVPCVNELAREADYTPAHFCRAFKKVVGKSPQEFLISCRMRHARVMLLETSHSIKAISAQLGYRNSEFFSRQFHQQTGMTPSVFRASNA